MRKSVVWLSVAVMMVSVSVLAQEVLLKDPAGDDNGPGTYTYPTDVVYKPGSFDLTSFKLRVKGDKADIEVGLNSAIEDPWRMGTGFSVQMVFVFIKSGKGAHTAGMPGLNIQFAEGEGWDKAIIMSPQGASKVKSEVESKVAKDLQGSVVIPGRVRGAGRTLSCSVSLADLGEGDPSTWGYQVVMQSNEGFPASTDLLTRKVNEFEGQHRFGGGNDGDCDPHVMDIFAGEGKGDKSEIETQHEMLKYECNDSGEVVKLATLKMVYPKK